MFQMAYFQFKNAVVLSLEKTRANFLFQVTIKIPGFDFLTIVQFQFFVFQTIDSNHCKIPNNMNPITFFMCPVFLLSYESLKLCCRFHHR